ncbi:GSCOCG00004303001-RA-CDS [Cotesia congregata]|nr:GSCOCG00004303001-RA-CDS [Cotesia congregata]
MAKKVLMIGFLFVIVEAVKVSDKIDLNANNDRFNVNNFVNFDQGSGAVDLRINEAEGCHKKILCSKDPLTIINEIQLDIVDSGLLINRDESQINNKICDLTVKSKKDQFGNLITTVQFKLVTKINKVKVNDVPIINGFRGLINSNNDNNHAPDSINPQIHQRYNTNNFQPSLGVPKNYFSRPQADFYYYNNKNNNNNNDDVGISRMYRGESYGRKPWMTSRDAIDDKIEPPLSKTSLNDQQ